jgi:hypothetical protein
MLSLFFDSFEYHNNQSLESTQSISRHYHQGQSFYVTDANSLPLPDPEFQKFLSTPIQRTFPLTISSFSNPSI